MEKGYEGVSRASFSRRERISPAERILGLQMRA